MICRVLLVPLLGIAVLLGDAVMRPAAASELLDFFWLRDNIFEETESGRIGRGAVDSTDILGSSARWQGRVERVLEPREGLWLVLVEMDPDDISSASHDLEVWTDDPEAAALAPGQEITVKGTIVDFRRMPGAVIHIVIDART